VDSYRVDVHPILEVLGADAVITGEISIPCLTIGPEVFELTGPVLFEVTLANTGTGVIGYGTARAPARVACVRCLEPFDLELAGEVEAFYVAEGRGEDLPEEQDVEPIAGDASVDILPAILCALAVEAPFAPLHDPDCAGLCPTCGCDRNAEQCDCDSLVEPTGPFAALKGLVADDEGTAEGN